MKEEIITNHKNHKLQIIKSDYNVYTLIFSKSKHKEECLEGFIDEEKLKLIRQEFETGNIDWMKDYRWNRAGYVGVTIAGLFLLGMIGYALYRIFIVRG